MPFFNNSLYTYLRNTCLFLLLIISFTSVAQNNDTLVSQTIIYHTSKANEIYIVWSLNYWKDKPDKKYRPENTFEKNNYMYTKMNKSNDSFSVTISLPAKSYFDFMFWIPIDSEGDSTSGWDTYGEITYSSIFDKDRNLNLDDRAIWMPDKKTKFTVLSSGSKFLLFSVIISGMLLLLFRRKLSFNRSNLFIGLLIASILSAIIIRLEMNHLLNHSQFKIFGAVSYDIFYYLSLALLFYLLIYLLKNNSGLKNITTIIFTFILIVSALFSLLNIELVKQLGKPLNYQWLYYSDFLTGTDAKNAVIYKLGSQLYLNIIMLQSSILIFGLTFSFLPKLIIKKNKTICFIAISLLPIISTYQLNTQEYTIASISNPVVELASSFFTAGNNPKLFSMPISNTTKSFIKNYHSQSTNSKWNEKVNINNVIVFVLESTPKKYVGIYDSNYNVTPNMVRWKNISAIFTNMYSHIPSTSNSMATMTSGLYPNIGYKSIIKNGISHQLPSLVADLKNLNWKTSLFASADLTFGYMDAYAKEYGFNIIKDSKTISCNYPAFHITNTLLDGLDDKCLPNQYFEWYDSFINKNTFSMIWTNQTHYPYFINSENEKKYVSNDPEFNRYLNGLNSSDEAFGILMDGLQKRNILNQTLIIVVGDHGEAFGTHNQSGHGSKIYEENINVPCIIYNPLLFNENVSNKISGLIDIAPTIAHVLGIKISDVCEGRSLFSDRANERTFFICPYSDFLFGTRTQNWKYIYNATLNTNELYDLKSDPGELHNLSIQFPEIVKREYEMIGGWVQFHNKRLAELENKNSHAN